MYYFKSMCLLLFFMVTLPAAHAQLFGGPERTAKHFVNALNKGNLDKALTYCILDLREDMEENFQQMGRRSERVIVNLSACENVETEVGIDCECGFVVSGHKSILIFKMTEVDGHWRIYDLDSKEADREMKIRGSKKEQKREARPVKFESPSETLLTFAAFNSAGKFKKSENLVIMNARVIFLQQLEKNPDALPVLVDNIDCYNTDSKDKVSCSCDQKTVSGKEETGFYDLVLIDGTWKILEFGSAVGAESAVTRFVFALANGNCEEAKRMTTGNASESVQGSIDAGCSSYRTEIIRVACQYENDSAFCDCTEKRDGMEMTFKYSLAKADGLWLVSDYLKDFELNTDGLVETPADSMVESTDDSMESDSLLGVEIVLPDVEASFPGGGQAMVEFMAATMIYPPSALEQGISGTVYLMFVVLEDGTITEVAVVKGEHEELNIEAVRMVKLMPKWIPGTVDGKNVASYYTLPIHFSLTD